jgi:hypothetical protein
MAAIPVRIEFQQIGEQGATDGCQINHLQRAGAKRQLGQFAKSSTSLASWLMRWTEADVCVQALIVQHRRILFSQPGCKTPAHMRESCRSVRLPG